MRRAEAGFTLVEVLVAMVVSALLLTVILQGSGTALRRLRAASDRREALIDGRYLLIRNAVAGYAAGLRDGRSGRLIWAVEESPQVVDPRGMLVLARIHATVKAASGAVLFDRSILRLKRVQL